MSEYTKTAETMTAKGGTEFYVTIERPVLTPEEYGRRLERLKRSTVELMKAKYAADARKAV